MPQTSYSTIRPLAIVGMLADAMLHSVESRVNTHTSEIPFGSLVKREATATQVDRGCRLCAANTDVPIGLALYGDSYAPEQLGTTGIKQYNEVSVMTWGRAWVTAGGTVDDNDVVHFDTATGKYLAAGNGTSISLVGQAKFRTSGVLNDLVLVDFDFRNRVP